MDTSRIATRLRGKISHFSGDVSKGIPKPARRFVRDMIYGVQAAESVMLTEIGRTLEERTSIKKIEERLSRNLQREGLERTVQENVLRLAKGRVHRDTLLIIDPSDVAKKHARKMQYLATVRDASEGKLEKGYWTLHVMGAELRSNALIPLYQRLYSAKAPDFISENEEILRAIDTVSAHTGGKGLWVMDRGGDRINLFDPMLDREQPLRFLFRLVGSRDLIFKGQKRRARDLGADCPCPYAETIVKIKKGKRYVYTITFGCRPVRLPGRPEQLYLLVIKGLGEDPLLVLTTEPLRRNRKLLLRFVRAYFKRWSIEETIRFVKQTYDLENVRVLTYRSLQNLQPLVLAAMYFAAVILDGTQKLRVMQGYVLMAAKRVFGIPQFGLYAIADGIRNLLMRHPGQPNPCYKPADGQLMLFDDI